MQNSFEFDEFFSITIFFAIFLGKLKLLNSQKVQKLLYFDEFYSDFFAIFSRQIKVEISHYCQTVVF